ncbi:uncharacterized protein [Atheta coriaria]|uniref:uncharacterized protein n=1 Tax=Dalotia coriaria TaxID=877792 RepID=UPI0031F412F0
MWFKTVIVICAVACTQIVNVNGDCPVFHCQPEHPNYAYFYGLKVECPENSFCNFEKENLPSTPLDPCYKPCVELGCKPTLDYTCIKDKTGFTVTDLSQTFACPANTECDEGTDCTPCKAQVCDKDKINWRCEGDDVYVDNVKGYCPIGWTCNVDHIAPCESCIKDDGEDTGIFYPASAPRVLLTSGSIIMTLILCAFQMY